MDPYSRPASTAWSNEIHVAEVVNILKVDKCLLKRIEEFAHILGATNDELLDIKNSSEKNCSKCLEDILFNHVSKFGMSVTIAELRAKLRGMELKYLEDRLGTYVDETRIVLSCIPPSRNTRPFAELQESPPKYSDQIDSTMEDLSARFVNACIRTPKIADENEMVSKLVLENVPESNEKEDFNTVVDIISLAGISEMIDDVEIKHKRVNASSGVFSRCSKFVEKYNPFAGKQTTVRHLKVKIKQKTRTQKQNKLCSRMIADYINKNHLVKATGIKATPVKEQR